METMTIGKLKTKFSDVIKGVRKGDKYTVAYGKKKEKIAVILPFSEYNKNSKKIGLLDKSGPVKFSKDFKITEEEFLNL